MARTELKPFDVGAAVAGGLAVAGLGAVAGWVAGPTMAVTATVTVTVGAATALLLLAVFEGFRRLWARGQDERRGTWRQVESVLGLYQILEPDRPLPATGGWAASPDFLRLAVDEVLRSSPSLVIECGSGVSSMLVGMALRKAGAGRLISLEHDPGYAASTRAQLERHGLGDVVHVVHAPLVPTSVDGRSYRWYDLSGVSFDGTAALLIVDGPPHGTGPMARYPALPSLRPHLAPGAVILLDDGKRASEQEAVRLWQVLEPAAVVESIPNEKGAWRIELP